MRSAVLLLIYNRPETLQRVFDAVRKLRPPRLYIAADGPRVNRPGDALRCQESRRIATTIDWKCEVKTLFRDSNLGCKLGVSGAIDWFFKHETEGIILEDDVLPLPGFFNYCDELLDRYRHDTRVSAISGCNLVAQSLTTNESYYFSRYIPVWGWASWRRVWQHYDSTMSYWPEWRAANGLFRVPGSNWQFRKYWADHFEATHRGAIDTWDHQLTFTLWQTGGLVALPAYNQILNLGFGPDATHTTGSLPSYFSQSPATALKNPLTHPEGVVRNAEVDALIDAKVFCINLSSTLKRQIRSLPWMNKLRRTRFPVFVGR